MKKFLSRILKGVVILFLLFCIGYIAYIFNPKRVINMKESLDSTSPEEYSTISTERKELLLSFDKFILESSTNSAKKLVQLIYSNPYKLNRLILKNIKKEVDEYNGRKLKMWYVYNMGVVSKYENTVVCFDLSTVIASSELLDLSTSCDYLLISHGDGDHFSPRVVKNVLESGGKVVIQDEKVMIPDGTHIFEESIKALVPRALWGSLYNLENKEELEIGDITVLGIKTMHRMQKETKNSWLEVNLGGYNIVHTGDGVLDDSKEAELLGNVDVLLANVIVVPLSVEDIDARYVVPLHMHELGHNRHFLEENSFGSYLQVLDNYDGKLNSKIYPLLWGEHLEIE